MTVSFERTFGSMALFGAALLAAPLARAGDGPGGSTIKEFTEEAQLRGIDYTVHPQAGAGRGFAFADLDGDGDSDLVAVGRADGRIGVFENDGSGHFTDRSGTTGLPFLNKSSGVSAADYDGDGDLDLYLTNWEMANVLARNEGGFQFTDVTAAAGVGDGGASTNATWADVDGDGRIDLYVANITGLTSTQPNRMYMNQGDGTFQDVAWVLGIDDPSFTWQAVFFDYDLDGDPDLYTSNDKGAGCVYTNHLFENQGDGTFIDVTEASGTAACIFSMGVAVGDVDGNGWPDLYCTNIQHGNKLFLNQGDRTFVESAEALGVASYVVGWGAEFLDVDNDGALDLYVCSQDAPNRLYVAETPGAPMTDAAVEAECDVQGNSFAVASADVDMDGDIDLLVQNDGEPLRLFINYEGDLGNYARFRVVGRGRNTQAVGARVRVRAGGTWRTSQVLSGVRYKSQSEPFVHVGLGSEAMVDEVVVHWRDGTTRSLRNFPGGATWKVWPPERLGDADGDGDRDWDDLRVFFPCFTGPGPGGLAPGCEVMDWDGDGDVDFDDLAPFERPIDAPGEVR